ncbi:hypothetical protein J1605_005744 [Eschrichtius robustus]|uniref:C2H2-type domain-containing protein n=1 Tax=Eschrichtius robustus TaxID=9764 RepID=A0AB34H9M0_ESCRO|nr:hypothetical protein J1605_005744 [Eschrichtius robustus]
MLENHLCQWENAHECTECGKAFLKKSWLNEHKRIHTGKKPHGCSVCGKTFSNKFKLIEHQRTHKGEKPYVCSECGKAFLRKFQLTEHQKTHMGNKPHVCSICGKAFYRKFKLTEHWRTRTEVNPYECTECGKAFCRKAELIIHQRNKRGEKTHKSGLIKHQRIHTGENPYGYSDCGNAFTTKTMLTVHQRTHTGERLYGCNESRCPSGRRGEGEVKRPRMHLWASDGRTQWPHRRSRCHTAASSHRRLLGTRNGAADTGESEPVPGSPAREALPEAAATCAASSRATGGAPEAEEGEAGRQREQEGVGMGGEAGTGAAHHAAALAPANGYEDAWSAERAGEKPGNGETS